MNNLNELTLNKGSLEATKERINQLGLHELVRLFGNLEARERVLMYRMLEKNRAIETFEHLDPNDQAQLVRDMEDPEIAAIVEALDPDDRTQLLEELPAKVTKRLLATMSPETRETINLLLGYPDKSVGRRMTPRYMAVREMVSVAAALAAIRAAPLRADEIDVIFVIDAQRHYQGYVRLGQLVQAAEPQTAIADLIQQDPVAVPATAPEMDAVQKLKTFDLPAIPVVDSEQRLVGAITFDDVIDLLEADTSETMYRKAGVVDLSHPKDEIYSRLLTQGGIWYPVRVRILFLFVTLLGGLLVGGVIDAFEEVLAAVVGVAIFIPLVMDMGGNVGTQSTTIFARGLARGHINTQKFLTHLRREVSVGLVMGLILGIIGGTAAYFWQGAPNNIPQLGLAVGLSLFVVIPLATFLGFLLPWMMLKLGLDHAPGADPFITTIKDFIGLSLYFGLVNWLIGVA